jgi:beta-glucosidase
MTTPATDTVTHRTWSSTSRVAHLLRQLTIGEKIALLHQYEAGVPRLGVGPFRTGTEALHGLAWLGPATVFPQAVGLGATWDPKLMRAVGEAIGDEVRGSHRKADNSTEPSDCGLNVWAPVVNPLRDPRWGRNEEGYSEDPWLTGRLSTAFAHGLRGDDPTFLKTAPTIKHFCGYNNETDRTTSSSDFGQRVLHEYELPAHRAAIADGAAVAVMASYNLVNGRPAHVTALLYDELRRWSDDDVLVVSDAYAPSNLVDDQGFFADHATAHAAALRAGVDSFTDNGANPVPTIERVTEALNRGLLTEADINTAVRRILTVRERLGDLGGECRGDRGGCPPACVGSGIGEEDPNPPEANPYADIGPEVVNCASHRALAREAAVRSIVLLRNDGLLPLRRSRVAVIGPLADTLHSDWYSGTPPYAVTPRDGLVEHLGESAVTYCEGVDRVVLSTPHSYVGVSGDGTVRLSDACTAWDLLDWGGDVLVLRSADTARCLQVDDDGRLVADSPGPHAWQIRETFELRERPGGDLVIWHVASGQYLAAAPGGEISASTPHLADATSFTFDLVASGPEAAAQTAREADVAIVVLGNHPMVNGRETEDRRDLALPAAQEHLLKAVYAANPNTALVITSSYPYAIGWADEKLPAVLWSSHGGQEYGRALAEILLGATDPSGRLPQTWYHSAAELPDLLDYDVIGSDATYLYYRGDPLYPFGHGLSYAKFAYSDLRLSTDRVGADERLVVTVDVANTGERAGEDVVQLYTKQLRSAVKQPLRALRGFVRVRLEPGERTTAEIALHVRDFAFWDVGSGRMVVETAQHRVMVGHSATDIALSAVLTVDAERITPRGPALLRATDYDVATGVARCPESPLKGDAVVATEPLAWITFHDVAMERGPATARVRVARAQSGDATIMLRCDDPLTGPVLTRFVVPQTGGPYAFVDITASLDEFEVGGLTDLYLVFDLSGTIVSELALVSV